MQPSLADLAIESEIAQNRPSRRDLLRYAVAGTAGLATFAALPGIGRAQTVTGVIDVAAVEAVIPALEASIERLMTETGIPGLAIGIVAADQVALLQAYGVRDTATNEPVDVDTIFQLASVSKPIASTVVAALVGDGFVSWDGGAAG